MRIKKEGVDGPLRGLFGPISRQIMNAIETISHKNNVSKRARIRLDCLYIAYIRSCMVAAGKHQLRMDFVSKKSGPCVAHEYASAPHARNSKSRIPTRTVNLNERLNQSRIRTPIQKRTMYRSDVIMSNMLTYSLKVLNKT